MKYIIKFCLPEDELKDFHPCNNTELEEHTPRILDFPIVEGKTIFLNVLCAITRTQHIFNGIYIHVW